MSDGWLTREEWLPLVAGERLIGRAYVFAYQHAEVLPLTTLDGMPRVRVRVVSDRPRRCAVARRRSGAMVRLASGAAPRHG
jgi:hypothetical protein